MRIACGVDIIEIERIRRAFEKNAPSFRDKVFTTNEIAYCESKNVSQYKSYAARFAAKEAFSKAVGTGISSTLSWKDIEILNNEAGAPIIELSDSFKSEFHPIVSANISLSLSHCDEYAIAYVTILFND